MIELLLVLYLAVLGLAFFRSYRAFQELEFLPSLFWAGMMAIPFAWQLSEFSPYYIPIQAVGVFGVAIALLIGDWWSARRTRSSAPSASFEPTEAASPRILYSLMAGIFILQGTHIALMPQVPFVELLRHRELGLLQDQHSRAQEFYLQAVHHLDDVLGKPTASTSDVPGFFRDLRRSYSELVSSERERSKSLDRSESSKTAKDLAEYTTSIQLYREREIEILASREDEWNKDIASGDRNAAVASLRGYREILSYAQRTDYERHSSELSHLQRTQQNELQVLRENSSKLLNVSAWFIYACQIAMILSPTLAFSLFMGRRWILGIFLLAFSMLYSKATLARGPILVLGGIFACLAWHALLLRFPRWRPRVVALVGLLIAPAFAFVFYFFATNPYSVFRFRTTTAIQEKILGHPLSPLQRGQLTFTLGDHSRRTADCPEIDACRNIARNLYSYESSTNFFAYRLFLTPIDVSHRWYTYFPDVSGEYIGLDGLTPSSRKRPNFQHPANRVGRWAYLSRFPNDFFESIMAYASVDADANARAGILGVFLACILTFILRIGLRVLRSESFLGTCVYYSSVVILAMNLPVASLQAILVPQGLLVFMGIALVLRTSRRPRRVGAGDAGPLAGILSPSGVAVSIKSEN